MKGMNGMGEVTTVIGEGTNQRSAKWIAYQKLIPLYIKDRHTVIQLIKKWPCIKPTLSSNNNNNNNSISNSNGYAQNNLNLPPTIMNNNSNNNDNITSFKTKVQDYAYQNNISFPPIMFSIQKIPSGKSMLEIHHTKIEYDNKSFDACNTIKDEAEQETYKKLWEYINH